MNLHVQPFIRTQQLKLLSSAFLCCLLFLLAQSSVATTQITLQLSNKELVKARANYQNALTYLNKGQKKKYQRLKKQLTHYPLYPYLLYYEYRRYISNTPNKKIIEFLAQYDDIPVSFRLRRQWLRNLAQQGKWDAYLRHFQPTSSTQLNCFYHWAQYQSGEKAAAFAGAKKLWIVGKSQDSACDSLFKVWIKSDEFHPDFAWQRIGLAINKGKTHLAKYLVKHLEKKDRPLVDLWVSVRANAKNIGKKHLFANATEKHQDILLYGVRRLLRSDQEKALNLLAEYEGEMDFNQTKLKETHNYIARYLANRYREAGGYWLGLNDIDADDSWLVRKIRYSLRMQDWSSVRHYIALLPEDEQRENQWRYWLARAIEGIHQSTAQTLLISDTTLPNEFADKSNILAVHDSFVEALHQPSNYPFILPSKQQSNNLIEAKIIYEDLALNRDFYGFLSSQLLNQAFSLNHEKNLISDFELQKIESYPGVQRSKELYFLGHPADARSEWYYAVRKLSPQEKSSAARLAELWGWHSRAIMTASKSDQTNDLSLRFPTAFRQTVAYESAKNNIHSDWVFSLIRQESAFTPDAKSPVGALGIMQIMPATGKQIARNNGLVFKEQRTLLNPEKNIKMGTLYLSGLLQRFDNNLVMATAAYNAGPHRVKRWRPKYTTLPGDIWIETIPFKETRNYVKNILTYQAIYRFQLGKDIRLSGSIATIPPKEQELITFELPADKVQKIHSNQTNITQTATVAEEEIEPSAPQKVAQNQTQPLEQPTQPVTQ